MCIRKHARKIERVSLVRYDGYYKNHKQAKAKKFVISKSRGMHQENECFKYTDAKIGEVRRTSQ